MPAEQGEEAAALATQALRLLAEAIELRLLGRGVLVALDLLGLGGIARDTAVERGKLALGSQTGLARAGAPRRITRSARLPARRIG